MQIYSKRKSECQILERGINLRALSSILLAWQLGQNCLVLHENVRRYSLDALVAEIDIPHYYRELAASPDKCSYCAADFESLSQFIQKKYAFPSYIPPVLIGYSSGATLVYAVLVQSPPNTFQGGINLGFCPDLPLTKPLCKGNGLEWQTGPKGKVYSFLPAKNLLSPWIAFQGTTDQVCDALNFIYPTGLEVRRRKNQFILSCPSKKDERHQNPLPIWQG